jgi:hypothetical protein
VVFFERKPRKGLALRSTPIAKLLSTPANGQCTVALQWKWESQPGA